MLNNEEENKMTEACMNYMKKRNGRRVDGKRR